MNKDAKIYVAGHNGMVGSAIVRKLKADGYTNILTASSKELNLISQADTNAWFAAHQPDYVFVAAAKVGGIHANNVYRADFLYQNLMIECNTIHAAFEHKVKKLLFLGSTCIYPKMAPQPLKESYLLSGYLEETNEPYAIAKIAGIKLCESYKRQYGCNFISAMPTNLYGPNDNYDLNNSHVLPALIRKFHEAKINQVPEVVMWGTGSPYREFLHADDLAGALCYLMENYDGEEFVNCGSGVEITIKDLALLVKEIVGYEGNIVHDTTKPDGTPRKLTDVSKLHGLGWRHTIELREGITAVYKEFSENYDAIVAKYQR
ncbi:MAG TPA: GDP-L-fucose synthase [Chitinophagales bacterium]|jgi:GDP-L-fucose synthase|nr:GDP-L-fucose synthase [Chitinophagales bacterium]HPA35616.1 GDP-L-fucose synthase [Chitinophagales bacterium]HQO32076.1 GDP-L-fucose synthase [Chitinophagales bacterium]